MNILKRLGTLFAIMLIVRVIGGIFGNSDTSQSYEDALAQAEYNSSLAARLDDPDMQAAVSVVRASRGDVLGVGQGAKLSFRGPDGRLTVTDGELAMINAEYRRFKMIHDQAMADVGDPPAADYGESEDASAEY